MIKKLIFPRWLKIIKHMHEKTKTYLPPPAMKDDFSFYFSFVLIYLKIILNNVSGEGFR